MRKDQRRRFLLASGALLSASLASIAQPARPARRIGFLSQYPPPPEGAQFLSQYLIKALGRAGYEVGKNLLVEARYADGRVERLAGFAKDLVRRRVELILSLGNNATEEATRATKTIPIVMYSNMFPVERGWAKSLARPGGNVTGTLWWVRPSEAPVKIFQILKEAVPTMTRAAEIYDPTDPIDRFFDDAEVDRRIANIGLSNTRISMTKLEDLQPALERIKASRIEAFWVTGGAPVIANRRALAAFAIKQKLVSISDSDRYLYEGGLLVYGPDWTSLTDRTVSFVDRILRGANPGELPIEETSKYVLGLNMTTARAIGFKPPMSFMELVDRQVE
jgi:putative ABC transport system substrate-binding protein